MGQGAQTLDNRSMELSSKSFSQIVGSMYGEELAGELQLPVSYIP